MLAAVLWLTLWCSVSAQRGRDAALVSVLGDPGMAHPVPAVAYCAWSFCNYAAQPAEYTVQHTRLADCGDAVRVDLVTAAVARFDVDTS